MGREVRRVPLDFDWPLNETWVGYLCPYRSTECPYCKGDGYSPAAKQFRSEWTGRRERMELAYDFVEKKCQETGTDLKCQRCRGLGYLYISPEIEALAETWERVDPPSGEGWQVWENVSEGSPVTPVYATAEALIDALVSGVNDVPVSRVAAERFVHEVGWCLSMMISGDVIYSGIESAVLLNPQADREAVENERATR